MTMPGRKFSNGSSYRYGFNGQMKSLEINPHGDHYTAEFWEYDSRTGRRWNLDLKPNVSFSPYSTFECNPIWNTDPKGDTVIFALDKKAAGGQGHVSTLFQNSQGEWFFFSQGATGNPSNSKLLTGQNVDGGIDLIAVPKISETKEITNSKGKKEQQTIIRNATANEVVGMLKNGKFHYGANDVAVYNTTQKQDAQIEKNAFQKLAKFKSGKEKYNLFFNNCVDGGQDIIQKNTGINLPVDFRPSPNGYFPNLKNDSKWFNLPQQEKRKSIDKMVKEQRAEMKREPKM